MSALRCIADGLWTLDGPVVRWFLPFPTRMTIVRLHDGGLLVHSPVELTASVRRAIESVGTPRHLVSPNKLHHLFLAGWQQAWPQALSHAPPGLRDKRPDLVFHGDLGDRPPPAWAADLDQLRFDGSRAMTEIVFFHRASRTVIFGDLVENFDPATLAWPHRWLARLGGVLAPHGRPPLDFRLSFAGPRARARAARRRLLGWRAQRVLMCHGVPVLRDAQPFLEAAFAWLGPEEAPMPATRKR